MRRLGFLGVLVGLSVIGMPTGSAVAERPCAGPLAPWLECWAGNLDKGEPYVVTLRDPLALAGPEQRKDASTWKDAQKRRHQLVVEVPEDGRTGDGGTALLVLAGGRMVHPEAKIDRIPRWAVDELDAAGVCVPAELCNLIVESDSRTGPLDGRELIRRRLVADLSTHVDAVPVSPPPTLGSPPPSGQPDDNHGAGRDDKDAVGAARTQDTGYSGTTWTAFFMALLLALLLLAFVIVIRRSRGPVAVGHRAGGGRHGGGPAHASAITSAIASATGSAAGAAMDTVTSPATGAVTSPATGAGGSPATGSAMGRATKPPHGDEATTRLRLGSARRHGRQVGGRPTQARTAVVRTELHPQGYVEIDRVLRRAVWAEPDRPPPAPGGLVDVAKARERDSDVLYAFPPTAARHAKGTPR
ncbi:hypothetical protein ACWD4G_33380 [Streptomyces sp. NPDC002643]